MDFEIVAPKSIVQGCVRVAENEHLAPGQFGGLPEQPAHERVLVLQQVAADDEKVIDVLQQAEVGIGGENADVAVRTTVQVVRMGEVAGQIGIGIRIVRNEQTVEFAQGG